MRHQLVAATAAAVLWTAVLAAQAPSPSARAAGSTAGERVTLVGCIERADQLTPVATTAETADSQSFVLMKADAAGATASERAAAVGTSGGVGPMYRLVGKTSELNTHVGQKVEVTGTREASDAANAAAQAANATNPTAANAPRLRVESVKMVAETCPR
ncbi:MAG TPA: hypothetical protein VH417_08300 [Vicinamibacterales bacterium]|jgi:hypothetical protein